MESDYPPIFFAASSGDIEQINQLAPGVDIEDLNQALAQAAALSQFDAAERLIELGAEANGSYSSSYGRVLFPSCEYLNPQGIKFLLDRGASPTLEAPLLHALATHVRSPNKYRCIGLLLKAGAPDPMDAVMAVHKGNVQLLRQALDKDPESLRRPLDCRYGLLSLAGASLLHLATEYNERDIALELLAQGLDVNTTALERRPQDEDEAVWPTQLVPCGGQTALFHAREYSKGMLELLLEHGADASIRAPFVDGDQSRMLTPLAFFEEIDQIEGNLWDETMILSAHKHTG